MQPNTHALVHSVHRAYRAGGPHTVDVVVDLTRSEDRLSLKPGDAVGDCHARRLPSVHVVQ